MKKSFNDLRGIGGRKYRFDFYLELILTLLEYDGSQHFHINGTYGGEPALRDTQRRDILKDKYAIKNGYNLLRIPWWATPKDMLDILTLFLSEIRKGNKVYISYEHYSKYVDSPGYVMYNWKIPDGKMAPIPLDFNQNFT